MTRHSRSSLSLISALGVALIGAACSDDADPAPSTPLPNRIATIASPGVGLAVVNSDFFSTSISLIDPATGVVTNGDCINSGSVPPNTTLALSGDVALPSWPQPDNLLVAIDRTNGALTWLDATTCTPLRQLDVSTGFYANPHDLIAVSPTKAYVTRYERNPDPTTDPSALDDGDDVLIIDPTIPAITGRIDLASYAVAVPGVNIQTRPDRARLVGTKLYVTTNQISDDFFALAHARVIVIDTLTDQVSSVIDLPSLVNCGGLAYVEQTATVVVSCAGDYTAADPAQTSGIAYIDVAASPPVELRHQLAMIFGRSLGAYSGIAEDGALGFAVTPGVFGGDPKDQLWSFDTAGGQATPIDEAGDSFVYGSLQIDVGRQRVFLTDALASLPRVQVYDYASGTPAHVASINANPTHELPPREIAWY